MLQTANDAAELTVHESVRHFAGYYPHPADPDAVIAQVGLTEKARSRVKQLSGGQRRRLDVALGIVGRPELLFLDEPTTGFDPQARRQFWDLIRALAADGTTILLTTHYLDEAEALADRVAVIAGGQIVAEGTPATLGGRSTAKATVSWVDETGPRTVAHRHADRGDQRAVRRRPRARRADRDPAEPRGHLPGPDRRHPMSTPVLERTALPSLLRVGLARGGIELKQFFRQKEQVVFTFTFPALILILLGSIFNDTYEGTGVTAGQVFAASMIGAGIISTSFLNLGIGVAQDREDRTLKRLRGSADPGQRLLHRQDHPGRGGEPRRGDPAGRGRHGCCST